MITLNVDSLLTYLQKKNYNAQFQKETGQIAVILDIEGTEYPLFLRILSEGPVLQLLTFLPTPIKEKTLPDLARLLHLLNKEMDIPGFGMDETAGVVFYRVTIPALDKKVKETLLETYLNSIQVICRSFTPVIFNVNNGTMSFDAVLTKAKEAHDQAS